MWNIGLYQILTLLQVEDNSGDREYHRIYLIHTFPFPMKRHLDPRPLSHCLPYRAREKGKKLGTALATGHHDFQGWSPGTVMISNQKNPNTYSQLHPEISCTSACCSRWIQSHQLMFLWQGWELGLNLQYTPTEFQPYLREKAWRVAWRLQQMHFSSSTPSSKQN